MNVVRHKGLMQVLALLMICSFSTWAMASGLTGARVIPLSKVGIYDGVKKIGEIGHEAPLPEGKILSSSDKFGLKLDGIYLVATENTKIAVTPIDRGEDIFVQEGRAYFAIRAIKNTLTFSTPQESVTVENVIIRASTETPTIKGYLAFEDNQMELVVSEGGQLRVVSAKGQQIIDPGNKLMVQRAQADLGGEKQGGVKQGGGLSPTAEGLILSGSALGVVVLGGIFLHPTGGGPTSPFQP